MRWQKAGDHDVPQKIWTKGSHGRVLKKAGTGCRVRTGGRETSQEVVVMDQLWSGESLSWDTDIGGGVEE